MSEISAKLPYLLNCRESHKGHKRPVWNYALDDCLAPNNGLLVLVGYGHFMDRTWFEPPDQKITFLPYQLRNRGLEIRQFKKRIMGMFMGMFMGSKSLKEGYIVKYQCVRLAKSESSFLSTIFSTWLQS
jgi:hypothetical protein